MFQILSFMSWLWVLRELRRIISSLETMFMDLVIWHVFSFLRTGSACFSQNKPYQFTMKSSTLIMILVFNLPSRKDWFDWFIRLIHSFGIRRGLKRESPFPRDRMVTPPHAYPYGRTYWRSDWLEIRITAFYRTTKFVTTAIKNSEPKRSQFLTWKVEHLFLLFVLVVQWGIRMMMMMISPTLHLNSWNEIAAFAVNWNNCITF